MAESKTDLKEIYSNVKKTLKLKNGDVLAEDIDQDKLVKLICSKLGKIMKVNPELQEVWSEKLMSTEQSSTKKSNDEQKSKQSKKKEKMKKMSDEEKYELFREKTLNKMESLTAFK